MYIAHFAALRFHCLEILEPQMVPPASLVLSWPLPLLAQECANVGAERGGITNSGNPGVAITLIPEAEDNISEITNTAVGPTTGFCIKDETLATCEDFEQGRSSSGGDDKTLPSGVGSEQGRSSPVDVSIMPEEETLIQAALEMDDSLERIMGTLGLDSSIPPNQLARELLSLKLSSVESVPSLSSRATSYSHASSRTKSFDYGLYYTRRGFSLESLSESLSMDA